MTGAWAAAAFAGAMAAAPALAHDDPAELQELQQQIREQQEEIARLRGSIEALEDQLSRGPRPIEVHDLALARLAPPPPPTPPRAGGAESATIITAEQDVPSAASYGEDLIVSGRVRGNATAFGGDLVVRPFGRVDGDAVSFGGTVTVDEGGRVDGNRVATLSESSLGSLAALETESALEVIYRRLIFFLSFAGAGVLVIGLFPERVARISDVIREHPLRSMALGASLGIALAVLALLFAVLIIPLPVSFMLVAVLGLSWLMGFVGLCQALGDRLPFERKHHGRWAAFFVGTLVVTFVSALPAVGLLVVAGASVLGMGAALTTAFGTR